jgi:hypothetical protein
MPPSEMPTKRVEQGEGIGRQQVEVVSTSRRSRLAVAA